MYCNHCGKASPDDARLCAYCGAALAGGGTGRRLVRPRTGRRIAGVCAGLAQYNAWNVTTIRILWLLLILFAWHGWAAVPHSVDRHAQ